MEPIWVRLLILIGLPVGGALLLHLWNRYKGRMARLYWSAEHIPMALATADTGFGEVQVLYNGQPTMNLHVTKVLLQNDSSRDLTDVVVHLAYLDGTRILRSTGFQPNSLVSLPHSDRFNAQLAAALAPNPQTRDIDCVLRNHEYRIPVLNRGAAAQFGLLVTRDDHARPTVALEISHAGVRVAYREPGTDVFGVRRIHAQVAGLLLGIAVVVAVIVFSSSAIASGVVGWLVGAFALAVGALAVKLLRGIGKLLS